MASGAKVEEHERKAITHKARAADLLGRREKPVLEHACGVLVTQTLPAGPIVGDVASGSLAERCGLKVGDELKSVHSTLPSGLCRAKSLADAFEPPAR